MKIINKLKTQKETLAMAKHFSEMDKPELTLFERFLALASSTLLYGVGIGFALYIFYGFFTQ